MASESLSWDHQVDDRIKEISQRLDGHDTFNNKDAPGLKNLLDKYLAADELEPQVFVRDFLKVFKDSETDGAYSQILKQHTPAEQKQVEAFVHGRPLEEVPDDFAMGPSLGVRQELKRLDQADEIAHVSFDSITPLKITRPIEEHEVHGVAAHLEKAEHALSREFHKAVDFLSQSFTHSHVASTQSHADAKLETTHSLLVYKNAVFQNWGHNLEFTPEFTCVPTTVEAVQTVVNFARKHDMSVRCSGYRHSWSPIFGKKGQITISMLDLPRVTKLPDPTAIAWHETVPTQLESIEIVNTPPRVPGNILVRVGCATTNERLRRWCVEHNKATLPINVVMVELTLGGSNAPICHGAGHRHQTLSDLVRKIEYVDAHGQLRIVDNPEHLRAASGCFGLMGVVTHLTMEFSPMTYALLRPEKMPVTWAVPPPADLPLDKIPPALRDDWKKLSQQDKAKRQQDFEDCAANYFYAEWFWFPYSDYAWVNTWNDTKDPAGVQRFPDRLNTLLQWLQTFTINVAQNSNILNWLVDKTSLTEASVTMLSRLAMMTLPAPDKPIKTFVPDALHFTRGVQNVRVRDIEVEMPLVGKREDPKQINWQLVQRAWWDAILLVYENNKTCPMRMPLEMRVMGGSDVVMAPQRGNSLGTCSIEVLTLHAARDIWPAFAQSMLDKWMALEDPATGKPLRTRPHWAKEWIDFKVNGKPMLEKLKRDYADERKEFMHILSDIGAGAGWTLADIKARFSNELFDDFFYGKDVSLGSGEVKPTSVTSAISKTDRVAVNVAPVADVV